MTLEELEKRVCCRSGQQGEAVRSYLDAQEAERAEQPRSRVNDPNFWNQPEKEPARDAAALAGWKKQFKVRTRGWLASDIDTCSNSGVRRNVLPDLERELKAFCR